ncbi:hypothetical protein DFH08DRAFT_799055 [Mycena albidolilacea]|uniref:Uncharacterized protein n=1 Tax=Mycena albidolilacea TaxID=1033008 RepID=A0AAD7APX1_9AGAR|nr:hypothetical protein DFH08DRAFT_799055 [Mycena albidolilacea]
MFETGQVNIALDADGEERLFVERVSFGVMHVTALTLIFGHTGHKNAYSNMFETSEVNIALNADREERAGRPSVERVGDMEVPGAKNLASGVVSHVYRGKSAQVQPGHGYGRAWTAVGARDVELNFLVERSPPAGRPVRVLDPTRAGYGNAGYGYGYGYGLGVYELKDRRRGIRSERQVEELWRRTSLLTFLHKLDIVYAPPCKLKTRSSGKSQTFLLLAVHMWRDVPQRRQISPTLADTPPPGASDPCPSPCSSSQTSALSWLDQECVQPPPDYNPPPTPAHATLNLHVVPCHLCRLSPVVLHSVPPPTNFQFPFPRSRVHARPSFSAPCPTPVEPTASALDDCVGQRLQTPKLTTGSVTPAQSFLGVTGLGLSHYRYNIGGGGVDVSNPCVPPETFYVGSGPDIYSWSADPQCIYFLQQASAHGVPSVTAFLISVSASPRMRFQVAALVHHAYDFPTDASYPSYVTNIKSISIPYA